VSKANVNSHGLNTSKFRWIFGFTPELLGCILPTENGLRMMYWAVRSKTVKII
jgi:hypothetical protein